MSELWPSALGTLNSEPIILNLELTAHTSHLWRNYTVII